MVGESNQNVFLIHKDASNFAEIEISEFEISRFDCINNSQVALSMLNRLIPRVGNGYICSRSVATETSYTCIVLYMSMRLNTLLDNRENGATNLYMNTYLQIVLLHYLF